MQSQQQRPQQHQQQQSKPRRPQQPQYISEGSNRYSQRGTTSVNRDHPNAMTMTTAPAAPSATTTTISRDVPNNSRELIQKSFSQVDRIGSDIKQQREQVEQYRKLLDSTIKEGTKHEREQVDKAIRNLQESIQSIINTPQVKKTADAMREASYRVEESMFKVKQTLDKVIRYIFSLDNLSMREKNELIAKINDKLNRAIQTDGEREFLERAERELQQVLKHLGVNGADIKSSNIMLIPNSSVNIGGSSDSGSNHMKIGAPRGAISSGAPNTT